MNNKRGKGLGVVSWILITVVLLFIAAVTLEATNVVDSNSIGGPLEKVASGVANSLEPLFSVLVGFDRVTDPANQSLLVLYFLLTAIICVRVIGATGLTGGEDNKLSGLINLAVGIIIAAIAVRAIPENMIQGMAGPSGGLVSVLVLGIPFAIIFALSMKATGGNIVRKMLWIAYIAYLVVLIFNDTIQAAGRAIIWIFVGLGILMLFLDPVIRRWWFKEKVERTVTSAKTGVAMVRIRELRDSIRDYEKIIADEDSSPKERSDARGRIARIEERIRELAAVEAG